MREISRNSHKLRQMIFGYLSTFLFLFFFGLHIILASQQYDIKQMNQFNHGIASSLLPGIDTDVMLAPKVFLNISEVQDYFVTGVNARFKDSSDQILDKEFFFKQNHLIPNIKLTNVMTEKKDCGSDTSNWSGKNRMILEGNPDSSEFDYTYPFRNDSCYWVYSGEDSLFKG